MDHVLISNGQSHRHLHTRTITNAAVFFLLPSRISASNGVVAGFLDVEGSTPRSYMAESKEVAIGKIVRLRLLVLVLLDFHARCTEYVTVLR